MKYNPPSRTLCDTVPDAAVFRLSDILLRANKDSAADPAVRDQSGGWTYADLTAESHRCADWLRTQGVRSGDRIVVHVPDSRHAVALLFGTLLAGATFVPISTKMKAVQVERVIADAMPALLISANCPTASTTWQSVPLWPDAGLSFSGVDATAGSAVASPELALLLYTSGSTSAPKAVMSTHAAVLFAASAIQAVLGYQSSDVVFCRIPLAFDYGLYQIFLAVLAGAELVLADPTADAGLLHSIAAAGTTVLPLVPSVATMLVGLARDRRQVATVRQLTNTGDRLPVATTAALRKVFPNAGLHLMYGITECKRVSVLECDGDLARPGSVGRPLPGTEVLILDAEGLPQPPDCTGEIVVRGPHVMSGYWRAPELSGRTFRPYGEEGGIELRTGDYGWLDADGYLYFEGRRDNIFKRNGVRTSSMEIEAAALTIPGVDEAAVVPPTGERDAALFIVSTLDAMTVLRQLHARLESAKVPSICRLLPHLPLNRNGKVDRVALAALIEGRQP